MENNPKISVIVPVYKVEQYLHRCVDSVLGQTYKNLEIILVDDGSPDTCGQMCDEYGAKYNQIKVVHQKNQGLSAARNTGLKVATGDYIAFVDSDDWIDPEMYSVMMQTMTDDDVEVVECNVKHRYEDTQPKIFAPGSLEFEDQLTALKRIISNQFFSVCRRLYNKKALGDLQFKVGVVSEDVYYTINLMAKLHKMAVISNPFYNYYKVGESITRGSYKLKTLESIDAALFVKSKVGEVLTNHELDNIIRDFISTILLYNYKSINHYPEVDPDLEHRSYIKKLLVENSGYGIKRPQLFLAAVLPLKWYNALIKFNKWVRNR
ncbi:glycosyltransferase [Spongiimicrobium sp. 3-5]|uniref:glycosyltransferase n=1 Tax=Spongiimicrobium sp. 3-5 TaxID=3332596 RepID=UPI00397FBD2C